LKIIARFYVEGLDPADDYEWRVVSYDPSDIDGSPLGIFAERDMTIGGVPCVERQGFSTGARAMAYAMERSGWSPAMVVVEGCDLDEVDA
jgi:hypothetical protein